MMTVTDPIHMGRWQRYIHTWIHSIVERGELKALLLCVTDDHEDDHVDIVIAAICIGILWWTDERVIGGGNQTANGV